MAKTNYLERSVLNHVLRGLPFPSPAAVFLALFTVAATDSEPGVEVSGGGYVRQVLVFEEPDTNLTSNAEPVIFPVATANWGMLVHYGIFDALTEGNLLYHAPLTSPRAVVTNEQFIIPTGQIFVGEN